MTVRTITPEELDWYVGLGDDDWLTDIIKGWWQGEGGQSAPDRCFVAEQEGKPVGRVFFYNLESSPRSQIMFGLHLNWETDWLTVGTNLLRRALAQMKTNGASSVEYRIYDIYQKPPELQRRVVEAAGFRLTQDKLRFVWKDQDSLVEVSNRLTFLTLADAGEPAFAEAVRRVTEQTLDRDDLARLAEVGPARAARDYVDILKDIEFRPDWWLLAYLPDGRLCGLVVPQRLDDKEGCINYIGVVPELRGSGYGLDLLLKGTAVLQAAGWKKVTAEIDADNKPLAAHMERAGFRHHGTLWCYRCDLVPASETSPKGS